MAQATSVATPPPPWDLEFSFPYPYNNDNLNRDPAVLTNMWASRQPFRLEYSPEVLGSGGTGTTSRFASYKGRLAGRMSTTAAESGKGWIYPWQMPWLSADVNAGLQTDPAGSVVAVLDVDLAFPAVFNQGTFDGFLLVPYLSGNLTAVDLPSGGSPRGGLGITGNLAGDVVFRSWSGGVVIDQVTLSVPDPTAWFSARFTFVRASSSSNATATLEVLGATVWEAVSGDGSWLAPPSAFASAWTYASIIWASANSNSDTRYLTKARFGRFTPGGVPVQGP